MPNMTGIKLSDLEFAHLVVWVWWGAEKAPHRGGILVFWSEFHHRWAQKTKEKWVVGFLVGNFDWNVDHGGHFKKIIKWNSSFSYQNKACLVNNKYIWLNTIFIVKIEVKLGFWVKF